MKPDFWDECLAAGAKVYDLTAGDSDGEPSGGGADDAGGPLGPWDEEERIISKFVETLGTGVADTSGAFAAMLGTCARRS